MGAAYEKQFQQEGCYGMALSETFEEMHKDGTLKQILGKYLAEPERFLEVDGYEK